MHLKSFPQYVSLYVSQDKHSLRNLFHNGCIDIFSSQRVSHMSFAITFPKKALSQRLQWNGLSSLCVLICPVKSLFLKKALIYFLLKVCNMSYMITVPKKALSQWLTSYIEYLGYKYICITQNNILWILKRVR